jgi:hypothetical protein
MRRLQPDRNPTLTQKQLEEIEAEYARRASFLIRRRSGMMGGVMTWMKHGREHMAAIARKGWEKRNKARSERVKVHAKSLVKARAARKKNLERSKDAARTGESPFIVELRRELQAYPGRPIDFLRNRMRAIEMEMGYTKPSSLVL